MNRWLARRFSMRYRFSLLLLVFMVVSCGSPVASSGTNTSAPTTGNATPAVQILKPAYNFTKFQTVAGMLIKLNGFICTEGPFLSNLTIATNQLSYDVGTAQIIQNYIQLLANNSDVNQDTYLVTAWTPPQPPKSLQWVAGSTTCRGNFDITNITDSLIEIQRVGVQLTATPTVNTYHYLRIPIHYSCLGCGAGGSCGYSVSITLDEGVTGNTFDGPLQSSNSVSCPVPMTIAAHSSNEVAVTLDDMRMRDVLYMVMPTLTIKTASGKKVIVLPDMTVQLAFTHTDKLPCYQFQGNAFVPCSHQ